MRRPIVLVLVAAASILSVACAAVVPRVKWTFTARSDLYGSPLVANVNPAPGLETIVSDAEARLIRCVDARGKLLWTCKPGWKLREVCVPSLSFHAVPGRALLVTGNADGMLECIDARDGKRVWARKVGAIEWGVALWADINGDGRDEVVAGTRDDGIVALDAAGRRLWAYRGEPGWPPMHIIGPIAAAAVDGDGKAEVFASTSLGPICVGGNGKLRWAHLTGDNWPGAPVIADMDHDGRAEVYCCSADENAVWCLDARTGAVKWRFAMLAGADVYNSSSMAVGDLGGSGQERLVVSDRAGHVYCLSATGKLVWQFDTETRTIAAVTLGDVDGDGCVETLVASDDRSLYCLDWRGELKWRYAANRRLVYPPTIADVDGDGKCDILLCACDRKLRCLTLDAPYDPRLVPWPSRRFDAAQTGSCFGKRDATSLRRVTETEALLPPTVGDFDWGLAAGDAKSYPKGSSIAADRARRPRGWHVAEQDDARWAIDTTVKRTGRASLRVAGGDSPVDVSCDAVELGPGLRPVSAAVYYRGGPASAVLRWTGSDGVVREDALVADPPGADGWTRLAAEGVRVPPAARYAALVLTSSAASGDATWWDDASIAGTFTRRVRLQALVNQVGYDVGAPKRFVVQTNLPGEAGTFAIVGLDGKRVYGGSLEPRGRIVGAYHSDWGSNYLRGDFSAFDRPGRYRVRVSVDGVVASSWPFEVGRDVIWDLTARRAYRLLYYQRCGCAVPGFHGPCHMDGARNLRGTRWYDLSGGWHDAGDYNPSETQVIVYGLANAYAVGRRWFDALDAGYPPATRFRREIPWGADQVRRMVLPDGSVPGPITAGASYMGPPEIETDNIPRTGDERPVLFDDRQDPSTHVAALAKCLRWGIVGGRQYVEAAERGMRWCVRRRIANAAVFDAAVDLYAVTHKQQYAAQAKRLFPRFGLDDPEAAEQYDAVFHANHRAQIRAALVKRADDILALSGGNPFGVFRFGPPDRPSYFLPPPPGGTEAEDGGGSPGGTNTDMLPAAITVAEAYRYTHAPRYLAFVYDQLDWLLGVNPYGLCMLEGAGSFNPPRYHACIAFAGIERGDVPGGIANGLTWRGIADDRPWFDMRLIDIPDYRSSEIWLPHTMRYLHLLAELSRTAAH